MIGRIYSCVITEAKSPNQKKKVAGYINFTGENTLDLCDTQAMRMNNAYLVKIFLFNMLTSHKELYFYTSFNPCSAQLQFHTKDLPTFYIRYPCTLSNKRTFTAAIPPSLTSHWIYSTTQSSMALTRSRIIYSYVLVCFSMKYNDPTYLQRFSTPHIHICTLKLFHFIYLLFKHKNNIYALGTKNKHQHNTSYTCIYLVETKRIPQRFIYDIQECH